ncbi:MAG: FAD-binding oxidoreductase [Hyphomicrobium sp.]
MSEKSADCRIGPHLWEAPPAKWNPDTDETLICCHVRDETHDVKSFLLRTQKPHLFRYRPGQFITLELEIDGATINRCYTMSSAPTRPDTLSITVKRQPGGIISNWLHDNLKPGVEIKALGPAGEFTCAQHPSEKYLFLSGGSGVTPLMSMARTHYDLGEDKDIVFVHSARSPRDIIFRRELAAIEQGMPHFHAVFICERPSEGDPWDGHTGYLTLPVLRQIARDFMHREVFCCGPEAYMTAVRTLLKDAGFDMARYHEESFSFGQHVAAVAKPSAEVPASNAAAAPAANVEGSFKIEFTKSGQTIMCGPDQFILDAAKAAGMRLPFSCAKGMCGTCKSKKISGEVVMTHQGGIRQREIDQGMFLPCCSKPLSDVVLE